MTDSVSAIWFQGIRHQPPYYTASQIGMCELLSLSCSPSSSLTSSFSAHPLTNPRYLHLFWWSTFKMSRFYTNILAPSLMDGIRLILWIWREAFWFLNSSEHGIYKTKKIYFSWLYWLPLVIKLAQSQSFYIFIFKNQISFFTEMDNAEKKE